MSVAFCKELGAKVLSGFTPRGASNLRDVAREYLRRLVKRIVVTDGDVVVEGRGADVVALMAESRGNPALSTTGPKVRTHVVGWRAREDSNL